MTPKLSFQFDVQHESWSKLKMPSDYSSMNPVLDIFLCVDIFLHVCVHYVTNYKLKTQF